MLGYTAGLTASAAAYHTAGGYWDPSEMEYIVSRQRDLQVQLELNSTISATLNYIVLTFGDFSDQRFDETILSRNGLDQKKLFWSIK